MFSKFQNRQNPSASNEATPLFRRSTDTSLRNLEVIEDDSPEAWQSWQDAVAKQALAEEALAEEAENTQPAPLESSKNEP